MILPFDERGLARAVALLTEGGVCAFPTETVYGLGARADRDDAVARIYATKGRPSTNPSIVHARDADRALALAREVPALAARLAAAFWPGPLTIVLPVRAGAVSAVATAGGDTVALRVPRHPIAEALLGEVGVPIAAPSANRSEHISPTMAEHVERSLGGGVPVLDGGPTGFGIESTIVRLEGRETIEILRRGSVDREALSGFARVVDDGDAAEDPSARLASPGRARRHYAPRVEAALTTHDPARAWPPGAGLVLLEGTPKPRGAAAVVMLPRDPAGYARGLYAALHTLEGRGVANILIEEPPASEAWAAVRDRLLRAVAR